MSNATSISTLLALLLATGCGLQPTESKFESGNSRRSTGYGKLNEGDATAKQGEPQDQDLDCGGVRMHGSHESCDTDDVKARDERDAKAKDEPVAQPEPDAEEPVEEPVEKPEDKPAEKPAETPAEPPKDPNIVEFRIKAGTANGAWNTQAEMVTAKVGQTVRIFNDDTVTHRLHTGGSPCPHGPNIPAGTSYDCVITRAVEPGNRPSTYDHIAGANAFFWMRATP